MRVAGYNEVRIWNTALSQAQLARSATLGPDLLPSVMLSTNVQVAVSANAVLDLDGNAQTLAGLSGSGLVTNGSLTVNGTLAPGGTNVIGTLTLVAAATLTGTLKTDVTSDGACDLLMTQGDLDVSRLTLELGNPSQLRPSRTYVIAACSGGTVSGQFVNIVNLPTAWHVTYASTSITLKGPRGTRICIF